MMTARELVRRCVDIEEHYKTLYVMGCFGAPMTAANKKRYTQNHDYNKAAARTRMIHAATEDTFGFDCVNLIKGILWGWDGDLSAQYGGARYGSNGVPDVSADGMVRLCKNVTADFREIVLGAAVWMPGHIGLYIGEGLAVECTPKWANGVQITAVGNLGKKAGYNVRTWKKWGLLPYVSYEEAENVTYEQWKEFMDRYRKELGEKEAPVWAQNTGEWDAAREEGISDGRRPQDLVTRAECAAMVLRGRN